MMRQRVMAILIFACTGISVYALLHLHLLQFGTSSSSSSTMTRTTNYSLYNDTVQVEVFAIKEIPSRNLINYGQYFDLEQFLEKLRLTTTSGVGTSTRRSVAAEVKGLPQIQTPATPAPAAAQTQSTSTTPAAHASPSPPQPPTTIPAPLSTLAKIPRRPTTPLRNESDFDLYISTRRLVILAVQRLNRVLEELRHKISSNSTNYTWPWPCAKWWSNPLHTQRNEIVHSTPDYDDHVLEFEASSPWNKVIFQTTIRVYVPPPPRQREFGFLPSSSSGGGNFTRVGSFQRFLAKNAQLSCFPANQTAKLPLPAADAELLHNLCSCNYSKIAPEDAGTDVLPSWPVNASFLPGDYMNFSDYASMFHILPAKHKAHCAPALKLLIMVSSAPSHFSRRAVIRETYGSRENLGKNQADLVFLFGRVSNSTLQGQLEAEARAHSDIIQANFKDSYHNLTLSHLSMYSYVHHSCLNGGGQAGKFDPPKHVLKADDDFVLNIGVAAQVAQANPEAEIIGTTFCSTKPMLLLHDPDMLKYYTPKYMYMGSSYPGYVSGVAYLIRSDVIPKFIQAALTIPIIHMDDAYITGLVSKALGIYPSNSKHFHYSRIEPTNTCELRKMANSDVISDDDMRMQWAALQDHFSSAVTTPAAANCTAQSYPNDFFVEILTQDFKNWCNYS